MRRTTARIPSLTVLLLLAGLVLTACSGGAMAEVTQATSAPPTATATQPADATGDSTAPSAKMLLKAGPASRPDDGPVLNPDVSGTVELWHFWGSPVRHNALRRVISLCQQELPNITVNDTIVPFGDIWTANLAAVAAGTGMADVIISDRRTLPREAADGVYLPLQEWADRDNVSREQFYNWAWDQGIYEGQIYGIPHETDVTVLFYNKTLFKEAGLDPNRPPVTWAEVERYADKLDKIGPDGKLERVAFFPLWSRGVDVWQYTNDADMIRQDGTPDINNPRMVQTVEWIKTWVDRYGGWDRLQEFRNRFGSAPNDLFMSSSLAMFVDIFGYNSQLQFYRPVVKLESGEETSLDWGIALLPANTKSGTWSGGFAMSIPTGAKNAAAGWEFIKCATSSAAQVSWARDTQAQPTNLKAATDPSLLADPAWEVVDGALQTSTGGIYVTRYPNWNEQLSQRWEMVWRNRLTPAQMLNEAQRAVEEAIQ